MFNFLKRKKEEEFSAVESADAGDEVKSHEIGGLEDFNADSNLGLNPRHEELAKPDIFAGNTSSAGVNEKDIQLIAVKVDLLAKKLEDVERKLDEVLEIAKQSK